MAATANTDTHNQTCDTTCWIAILLPQGGFVYYKSANTLQVYLLPVCLFVLLDVAKC